MASCCRGLHFWRAFDVFVFSDLSIITAACVEFRQSVDMDMARANTRDVDAVAS